jgi:hypothetical protein
MMRNTLVKAALAAGALLLAAVPASAQGFGYGSRDGYGGYSGSYSNYGRGYSNPYQNGYGSQPYNSYGNSYGDSYGYGGYMRRHHRDWNDRRWHRDWSHQDRYWD